MYNSSFYFNLLSNHRSLYGGQKVYFSANIGTNSSADDFPLTHQTLQNQIVIVLARVVLLFKEKPMQGKVIAVGKGKVAENGQAMAPDVRKGDRILFSKYAGSEVKIAGKEHLIIREDDVLGAVVLREASCHILTGDRIAIQQSVSKENNGKG